MCVCGVGVCESASVCVCGWESASVCCGVCVCV